MNLFFHRRFKLFLLIMGAVSFLIQGCTMISLFSSPTQERGMQGFFDDNMLRLKLNSVLADGGLEQVEMLIHKGKVLLLGVVDNASIKNRAVALVKKTPGVVQVMDEISIGRETFSDYSKDAWLRHKLSSALFFDSRILSQNYQIAVINKIVYILGTAQDQTELNWVLEHAEGLSVRGIVPYVTYVNPSKDPSKGV
jgi:osmotically-inducible protein OsmY